MPGLPGYLILGAYTRGIIFIAAISFEPRLMQWFLMSELKQPSSPVAGPSPLAPLAPSRPSLSLPPPRRDAIFSLKRFIGEPRRGAALLRIFRW